MVGIEMRSIENEIENILKANAPSFVAQKTGFASDGFLPYCGTFDLK
jgi:hypothetical protein